MGQSTSSYEGNLQARLEHIYNFAREHLKLGIDKTKERYDAVAGSTLLKRGESLLVYIHNVRKMYLLNLFSERLYSLTLAQQ